MRISSRKKVTKGPITMPKAYTKRPKIVKRKKQFQLPNIFPKKGNKYGRHTKTDINYKILIIPLLLLLLGGFVYLSIRYITFIRSNAFDKEAYIVGDVVGIEGIPEYPGSEFIFKNKLEDSVVKEFLASGNSAYRLIETINTDKIQTYYKEELTKKGWELVMEVALGTEDRKYGQYWVKEGRGLRIYSKFKDIWYESITEEEARTALANRVQEEIEREMLMASSDKQDLLPDFPWKIQIPKEYIIKYSATDIKDFRAVSFQKLGSNEIVEIYPIGKITNKALDYYLEDYCKKKSSEESTYSILNTVPSSFREYSSLIGSITSGEKNLEVVVLTNSFNNYIYILSSTQTNDPLLGYILENIKPMGSKD